jgi:hypothetical protein
MDALHILHLVAKVEALAGLIRTEHDARRVVFLCTELVALLRSEEACDAAAALAAGAAVVAAMEAHKANVDVLEMAFEALRLLMLHASCEVPLDAVVASMRVHNLSQRLQITALLLLTAATREDPAACSRAELAGATHAVMAAMRAFSADERLQLYACQALVILHARAWVAATSGAALDALITTMRTHADSTELQEMALFALSKIELTGAEAVLQVPLQRALEAVAMAMRMHPTEAVAERGCTAMLNLMARVRSLPDVCAVRFVQAALVAMQHHPGGPSVQHCGCRLLTMLLSANSALLQRRAGDAGAVETLLAVVRDAAVDDKRCLYALFALAVLLRLEANRKRALASGALDAVLGAMHARGADTELLLLGSKLLSALVSNQAHVGAVMRAAAAAMRLHSAHEKLQAGFLHLLCGMIRNDGCVLHGEPGMDDVVEALVRGCDAACRAVVVDEARVLMSVELLEHILARDGAKACAPGLLEAVVSVITKCSERRSHVVLCGKCANILQHFLVKHDLEPGLRRER